MNSQYKHNHHENSTTKQTFERPYASRRHLTEMHGDTSWANTVSDEEKTKGWIHSFVSTHWTSFLLSIPVVYILMLHALYCRLDVNFAIKRTTSRRKPSTISYIQLRWTDEPTVRDTHRVYNRKILKDCGRNRSWSASKYQCLKPRIVTSSV